MKSWAPLRPYTITYEVARRCQKGREWEKKGEETV